MQLPRLLALLTLVLPLASPASDFKVGGEGGPDCRGLAQKAVGDILGHWWIGDEKTGHLMPTHGGIETKGRGVLWERTIVICALEGLSMATGDTALRERIAAQWQYDKAQFKPPELEACGPGSPAPWCDDAAWQLLYYNVAFEQTGDTAAIDRAKGLIHSIHDRWYDSQLGGGLWYNEQRKLKSLYAVACVYGCLGVYEATGDRVYLDLALEEYHWIESHLLRPDHLYWCDYSAGPPADPDHPLGPVGSGRGDHIHTAGSAVFLGGNMGMGASQAYLYQLTGDATYRAAAVRTAKALSAHLTDSAGRYINDRDAFDNGVFGSFWVRRMVGLLDAHDPSFTALRATALSIANSRTTASYHPVYGPDGAGFYPGDWDGGTAWERGQSLASMMHVSASSAGLLVAAVYLPN
jgi:predicted alpha-1,6-mannanase (GH76 family)